MAFHRQKSDQKGCFQPSALRPDPFIGPAERGGTGVHRAIQLNRVAISGTIFPSGRFFFAGFIYNKNPESFNKKTQFLTKIRALFSKIQLFDMQFQALEKPDRGEKNFASRGKKRTENQVDSGSRQLTKIRKETRGEEKKSHPKK